MRDYFTIPKLVDLFESTTPTVRYWVKKKMKSEKHGRDWAVKRTALEDFINERIADAEKEKAKWESVLARIEKD